MGRQNKVNYLFKGLSKTTEYTVAEIVARAQERGTLGNIYPECTERDQVRKARQLVQSHINSRGIQNSGIRKDLRIYRGGLFTNNEEEMAEWVSLIQNEALDGFKRWSKIWIPIAVASLFFVLLVLWVVTSKQRPHDRVLELAALRDVNGLRALAAESRQVTPVLLEEEVKELLKDVGEATGLDLDLKVEVDNFVNYPLHLPIARELSQLQPEIYTISLDRLAAVFPFLKNPLWVFADEKGEFFPVSLGTNVRLDGNIGHIYKVNRVTLSIHLQSGEDHIFERSLYASFGDNAEFRVDHSVILAREGGNLNAFVEFLGREMEVMVDNRAEFAGQISGFFPEVTDLAELLPEFEEAGIFFDGHTILVKKQPEIKLLFGFYNNGLKSIKSLNRLFGDFDRLAPQTIKWQPFSDEPYLYEGQSFFHICQQTDLLPTMNGDSIILVR